MMGVRASSEGVEARLVRARRDSKVGRREEDWDVGSSVRRVRSGRIADVRDWGFVPPNICEGLVEMRISARAWAVARRDVVLSSGKTE